MKMVYAVISQSIYEDDYEKGEVTGTYHCFELESKCFNSAEEAMSHFKKYYGIGEITLEDGMIYSGANQIYGSNDFLRDPRENEINAWKNGELNLYAVVNEMKLYKLEDIADEELKKLVKED